MATVSKTIYDQSWPEGSIEIKLSDNGDGTFSELFSLYPSSFLNISGSGTYLIKSGSGILDKIIVNKAVSNSTITLYDNTGSSGRKIGTITNPLTLLTNQLIVPYNCQMTTGLTIVTSGADDVTVLYR